MIRRFGILAALLAVALACPGAAAASPSDASTITFDEGYVNDGQGIGGAYTFVDGVTFGTPSSLGFPGTPPAGVGECAPVLRADGFAGTSHAAATDCGSGEFPPPSGFMYLLQYARTTVSFYLKAFANPSNGSPENGAEVVAYDHGGVPVSDVTYSAAQVSGWTFVSISVNAANPIQYVHVNARGLGSEAEITDVTLPAAGSGLTPYWKLTDPTVLPVQVNNDGSISLSAYDGEPLSLPLQILRENGSTGTIDVQASDGASPVLSSLSVDENQPNDTVVLHMTAAPGHDGETATVVMSGTAGSSAGAYDGAPLVFHVTVRPAFALRTSADAVGAGCPEPNGLTLQSLGDYTGAVVITSNAGFTTQLNVTGPGNYDVADPTTTSGESVGYTARISDGTAVANTRGALAVAPPALVSPNLISTNLVPSQTLRFQATGLPCDILTVKSGPAESASSSNFRPQPSPVTQGYSVELNDYATSGPAALIDLTTGKKVLDLPSLSISSFRNTFGFSWRNTDYGLRLDDSMIDELFGKDQTNISIGGWLVRKPEASMVETVANNHIGNGICFGMAYSSLEFHDFPAETAAFAPRPGENDPWQFTGPTRPSDALLRYVTERFALQFTDQLIPTEVNAVLGVHGTDDALNTIEQGLSEGEPVIIGMINWSGLSVAGHTVLAYAAKPQPDGSTVIRLANSNVPYTTAEEGDFTFHYDSEVTNSEIIIKNGNWTFPELGWSGSEADLVVYKHSDLPILNGKAPALPSVFVAAPTVVFGSGGDAVTQLSGSGGALFAHGHLAPQRSWPKGVAPLPTFNSHPGPLQLVSMSSRGAGAISATVRRGLGGGAMNLTLPGLEASLHTGAGRGTLDQVGVDPRNDSISYQTGARRAPFGGVLLSSAAGRAASAANATISDHTVQFQLTSARGGKEQVSFGGASFVLHHVGPAANLSLIMSAFATDGHPVAIALPTLRLRAGEALRVTPANWKALGRAAVRIAGTVRGRTSTRLIRGRMLGRGYASVRGVALRRPATGRDQLDLAVGVRGAPQGASLSISAVVLKGRRVVAHVLPVQLLHGGLRTGVTPLTLAPRLGLGRYRVRVRLLETTANGPVEGSVVVSRTLGLSVR